MAEFVLYGAHGWGSALAEAALTLCGAPYRFENVHGFDQPGPQRERLVALNPTAQVPTLVLPDGAVMTESAAITLLLAERYPAAELAPPAESPDRARFLRRLIWLVAAVYPTFTYADYPERYAPGEPEVMRERVRDYRKALWLQFEAELGEGWALGDRFSALDVYISVMTRWGPGRPWFEAACPKLFGIARRVDALPMLHPVWRSNFPPA